MMGAAGKSGAGGGAGAEAEAEAAAPHHSPLRRRLAEARNSSADILQL